MGRGWHHRREVELRKTGLGMAASRVVAGTYAG